MDRSKIKTFYNTIKYLKPIQIYYRLFYFSRRFFSNKKKFKGLPDNELGVFWEDFIWNQKSLLDKQLFVFLNKSKEFNSNIDWNFNDFGKLWTYNLNYFDFLNQQNITIDKGLELIEDYIENDDLLLDGKEPYVISLRSMNWIKFLSRNKIKNFKIDQILYNHYQILLDNLEYHLLGNHLLENGFSLFFGAYYFKDEYFYKKSIAILNKQLLAQTLNDGGHIELSPMYHQIILGRVLDCINLIELNNTWKNDEFILFLRSIASKMIGWLKVVTYRDYTIPMVNDSAYDIAPNSLSLFKYAEKLKLKEDASVLNDSGYRKFTSNSFEVFFDVGNIQPSYQPGHAHSDTFSFELFFQGQPIIVDPGISTYEKNDLRQLQRSTAYHNTFQLGALEQTKIWGGFRVAERATVFDLEESANFVSAKHDGYKKNGIIHQRTFELKSEAFIVADLLHGKSNLSKKIILNLHPNVKVQKISNTEFLFGDLKLKIAGNVVDLKQEAYGYCLGFNKMKESVKLVVYFETDLTLFFTKH